MTFKRRARRSRRSSTIPRSRSRSRARPRRPSSTGCSSTTTSGAAIRRTGGPRSNASRCSARSRPKRTGCTSGTLVARATLRPGRDACELVGDRAAGERRPAHRGDRHRRLAEPRRKRGLRPRVRIDGRSRQRAARLRARGRRHGYPVWVGGRAVQVREIVAIADGWNSWGTAPDRVRASRARWYGRSRRTRAHVGRAGPPARRGCSRAGRAPAAVCRRRGDVDHHRSRSTRATPRTPRCSPTSRARLNA